MLECCQLNNLPHLSLSIGPWYIYHRLLFSFIFTIWENGRSLLHLFWLYWKWELETIHHRVHMKDIIWHRRLYLLLRIKDRENSQHSQYLRHFHENKWNIFSIPCFALSKLWNKAPSFLPFSSYIYTIEAFYLPLNTIISFDSRTYIILRVCCRKDKAITLTPKYIT